MSVPTVARTQLGRLPEVRPPDDERRVRNLVANPTHLKELAISKYGGSCFLCGEEDLDLLGITHPETAKCGIHKYKFLLKEGWPPGGRVVCLTCTGSLVRRLK